MKAAVCHEFGKPLVIEDIAIAAPGEGEVKVTMKACAICHSDIHYAEGAWGGALPAVYGHEAAGVVAEIGRGVKHVSVGDHVVVTLIRSCGHCALCLDGHPTQCITKTGLDEHSPLSAADGSPIVHGLRTAAFAEEVVVDASQLVAIPKDVPWESASLLACGVITGLGAVTNTAKVRPGSCVAVIGTGGVGLNSIQGAALCGAASIVAIDLADDKLDAAKTFGATHTCNPSKEDPAAVIKAANGGMRADYVFVTVGSTKAMEQAATLIRRAGEVVIVGMPAVGEFASFEMINLADAGQRITGSKMGQTRVTEDIPKLVELYNQGRLKLDQLVTKTYRLEEINEAFAAVNRGEALRNVILFD